MRALGVTRSIVVRRATSSGFSSASGRDCAARLTPRPQSVFTTGGVTRLEAGPGRLGGIGACSEAAHASPDVAQRRSHLTRPYLREVIENPAFREITTDGS